MYNLALHTSHALRTPCATLALHTSHALCTPCATLALHTSHALRTPCTTLAQHTSQIFRCALHPANSASLHLRLLYIHAAKPLPGMRAKAHLLCLHKHLSCVLAAMPMQGPAAAWSRARHPAGCPHRSARPAAAAAATQHQKRPARAFSCLHPLGEPCCAACG